MDQFLGPMGTQNDKAFLWLKYECLRASGQCVQNPTTAASSLQKLTARDCSPQRPPTGTSQLLPSVLHTVNTPSFRAVQEVGAIHQNALGPSNPGFPVYMCLCVRLFVILSLSLLGGNCLRI